MRAVPVIAVRCAIGVMTCMVATQAWAVDTAAPTAEDSWKKQDESFELDARAAEQRAIAKQEQANATDAFIKQLETAKAALAAGDALGKVDLAIAGLRAQYAAESAEAVSAKGEAAALRTKADNAHLAIILIRQAPPVVHTAAQQPSHPTAPVATPTVNPTVAFGMTRDVIFTKPNDFMAFDAKAATAAPEANDRAAPRSVALQWARNTATRVGDLLFDRSIDRRQSGASLTLGKDGTRLSLQVAKVTAGKYLCRNPDPNSENCTGAGGIVSDKGYQHSWSFGLSSEAEDGFGKFFTGGGDGGFEDNLRFNFGFNSTRFHRREGAAMDKAMAAAETKLAKQCRQDKASEMPGATADRLLAECSSDRLLAWSATAGSDGEAFAHAKGRQALSDALWGQEQPDWDFGINTELGYRAFSYRHIASIDAADLDPMAPFGRKEWKRTYAEWQLDGHVGKFGYVGSPDEPQLYGAVLAEIGREYAYASKNKKKTVCPVATPGQDGTVCSALNIAPPDKDDFYRLGTQFKVLFPGWGLIPSLGVSPKVTWDADDGQGSDQLDPAAAAYFGQIAEMYSYDRQSEELGPKASDDQKKIVEALRDKVIVLVGHTDDTGDARANAALSERRARTVAALFAAHGIPEGHIFYQGAGEALPIADNNTDEGRARNRRVEILDLPGKEALVAYLGTRAADPTRYRPVPVDAAPEKPAPPEVATVEPAPVAPRPPVGKQGKKAGRPRVATTTPKPPVTVPTVLPAAPPKPKVAAPAIKAPPTRVTARPGLRVAKRGPSPAEINFGGDSVGFLVPDIGPATTSGRGGARAASVASCDADRPHISYAVRSLDPASSLKYNTADYMPGLYGTSWFGTVNGQLVSLTRVTVLRDGGMPVAPPQLLIYRDWNAKRAKNARATLTRQPEVNVYRGRKGLLYRVFTPGAGNLRCIDVLMAPGGGAIAPGSQLYYSYIGELRRANYPARVAR